MSSRVSPRAPGSGPRGDPAPVWRPRGRPTCLWCLLLVLLSPVHALAIDLQQVIACSSSPPYFYCIFGEPALSPDGRCVAFTSGATSAPVYEWWSSIAVVQVAGGGCVDLAAVASPNNWHVSPAWSPDGMRLAFVSDGYDSENYGLWTVEAGDLGSPPASLVRVVPDAGARTPAWSLDGGSIAYAGQGGIYVVPSGGGASVLMTTGGIAPTWGPEGQLAFARETDLWIRESDGRERQLTRTAAYEAEPAWSPRGTWIAYASNRAGSWDIWLIAATGGTPVQVTSSPADEGHPSWSAAGDRIAFVSTLVGNDSIWLATNLPDWTTAVEARTWSFVKQLYRE